MKATYRGILLISVMALATGLAGCAATAPAPVSDRVAPLPEQAAAPKLGKDYYVVKKGDTLYSIARESGRDPKDVAAWNNLENPGALRIGQTLRVTPPDGSTAAAAAVAVAKPIAGPALVEVKPLGRVGGNSETFKREPKGGKQPYSEQALVALQKKDELPPRTPDAGTGGGNKQDVKSEVKPESRPEAKAEAKAETKPEAAHEGKNGDNDSGIDWIWPANGKLLSQFNEPASKGIDISGRTGEAVLAAAGGKVMYVGSGIRGYGNLVIIKHSNGFLSAYAHNRTILVKENQAIGKGQKIAELGDSDSDQPKLHFEIRRQGKPVDPLKYLPAR